MSAKVLSQKYTLSIPHIYRIVRTPSLKSSKALPQQKFLTTAHYQTFSHSPEYQYVIELAVTAAPITPAILEQLLCAKENKLLLLKVFGKSPKEVADYTTVYGELKCVDYIVGIIEKESQK